MFEKEAEKYYESKPVHTYVDSLGFFHDLEGIKQAYIQGRIDERKANEWHYVKDGDLPKENQLVMVYRVNPLGANIAITNWYDSYKNTKVIAWKEVVLPELKESE